MEEGPLRRAFFFGRDEEFGNEEAVAVVLLLARKEELRREHLAALGLHAVERRRERRELRLVEPVDADVRFTLYAAFGCRC